jgi:hypothetical protein
MLDETLGEFRYLTSGVDKALVIILPNNYSCRETARQNHLRANHHCAHCAYAGLHLQRVNRMRLSTV